MDFELMRAAIEQAVPFNQHLGLEVAELGLGRGVVLLPDDSALRNHVGSQHASALFAVGEAASGAAFVAAFADQLEEVTAVVDGATVDYRRIAHGPITATGVLGADPDQLLAELERDRRVDFAVDVALTNGAGDVVGEMTVRWHIRRDH
jgi:acyl-coenzyme A thioesterase PaaI-like protein